MNTAINIHDKKKIAEIQKEFGQLFPYLKIEFFSEPQKVDTSSSSTRIIRQPGKTLGECRTVHPSGTIRITPETTVAVLEQNFRSVFGLSVQVFRKSGKAWLETTVTDEWSLDKQNKQGEALSNYLFEDKPSSNYEAAG